MVAARAVRLFPSALTADVAKLRLVGDPEADALLDQQVPRPICLTERFNSYPIGEQKRSATVDLPIVRPSS
jgi:hypothetical protein